jgi:hypothetical protein
MEITDFKRILASFADDPSDVDVGLGNVVAQIREDLVDINLSYSKDGERRLLVTENGVIHSARSWLLNRVARLPQLAERIIATTSASENSSKSPFVTPMGLYIADLSPSEESLEEKKMDDSVGVILEKVENPLPGATSVLYITSDAGEGKTTVINRAAGDQAVRFRNKTASSLIVPISLSGRAFLTFDDAVIAALVNKLRFGYFYFGAFIELVRMGALVPAFDGYEEMLVEGSKGEAVSALGNLVQSLDSQGCVLIAARKAFFEYLSFKTQARLLDAIGSRSASFSRMEMLRWSKSQFCRYGELRNVAEVDRIHSIVAARLGADHPILTRAVLVKRLFDVAAEITNCDELAQSLGENPHDYFFTFVNAIVQREASDKWLARVTSDVSEPLLTVAEHHQLLSSIALEMWQSSRNSLRNDLLSVIVDLFCEGRKKGAAAVRQIQERIKQHALLTADTSSGFGVAFDHEDFQNFYLGEGLGHLLKREAKAELQAFLSVNVVPPSTIEQAVQYLVRKGGGPVGALELLVAINAGETGFSFCRENCAALCVRLCEFAGRQGEPVILTNMQFPAGILSGRSLSEVVFERCGFQPTDIAKGTLQNITFRDCTFERLEIVDSLTLGGCLFENCRIDLLSNLSADEYSYDPFEIVAWLSKVGARVISVAQQGAGVTAITEDRRIKLLERFLRIFLRSTQVDEDVVRLRLGKTFGPMFFSEILPSLRQEGILEDVPWKGRGVKERYKLAIPMGEIQAALEIAKSDFDAFIQEIRHYRSTSHSFFEDS